MNSRLLGASAYVLFSVGMVASADASLVSRLGGQAVYDTDLNITWLANANLAASNTFGVTGINADGSMNWNTATSWIMAMNTDGGTGYLEFNDWRLPTTTQPDLNCSIQTTENTPQGSGFNCTGSEMGHLFSNELSGVANSSILTSGDPDLMLFTNVQANVYRSGTEFVPNTVGAWYFHFGAGYQDVGNKTFNQYAWAVRSGDVSAVPVPAAAWLFVSGLISLAGTTRRKKAS